MPLAAKTLSRSYYKFVLEEDSDQEKKKRTDVRKEMVKDASENLVSGVGVEKALSVRIKVIILRHRLLIEILCR
jgi:hypothetical protein